MNSSNGQPLADLADPLPRGESKYLIPLIGDVGSIVTNIMQYPVSFQEENITPEKVHPGRRKSKGYDKNLRLVEWLVILLLYLFFMYFCTYFCKFKFEKPMKRRQILFTKFLFYESYQYCEIIPCKLWLYVLCKVISIIYCNLSWKSLVLWISHSDCLI